MQAEGVNVAVVPTVPEGNDYDTPPTISARVRYRLRRPADPANANVGILTAVKPETDILWLDAADMVRRDTVAKARRIAPGLRVVWYAEDDLMNSRLRTVWLEKLIPEIDLWVTTKSFNTAPDEMPSLGVRKMLFVNNSYDPSVHRPVDVPETGSERFGTDISFVGTYEEPRARSIASLATAGFRVRVWGNGWGRCPVSHDNMEVMNATVYNDDYARVIGASAINLCFLRHANRDLQTCRSIEIPACGGFMVHERNDEITTLLREDAEAVYFGSDSELVEKCDYWLKRPVERADVSGRARRRVQQLELDHRSIVRKIVGTALGSVSEATP